MTEIADILPSALAVAVSVAALYVSGASARRRRAEDTVKGSYDEFEQLSRLRMEHWSASHLLEMPENYAVVRQYIADALTPLSEAERNKMLLCERSIAIAIFTVFEETVYHRDRAVKQKDRERVEFLGAVLDYFTGRLLANPRLRWLWSPEGDNLCVYFEAETMRLYDEARSGGGQVDGRGSLDVDPIGPYWPASDAVPS